MSKVVFKCKSCGFKATPEEVKGVVMQACPRCTTVLTYFLEPLPDIIPGKCRICDEHVTKPYHFCEHCQHNRTENHIKSLEDSK